MITNSPKNPLDSDEAGMVRWLPPMVVMGVVAGFVALSWYAYHAGTQSVKDEDLLVVEADKTPMKEKPVDAGGMQFPNQDKTIYDTFAGSKQPPRVERVLPSPEEPVTPPPADNSETAGWINDKYHQTTDSNAAKPEQVIAPAGDEEKAPDVAAEKKPLDVSAALAKEASKELQMAEAKPQSNEEQPASYVAKPAENNVPAPPKEEKKKPVKKEAPAAPAEKADNALKVQLGAYRSEDEARDAWNAMQKKHADLLADAEPSFIKADLGAKGIYYRLRIGSFSNAAEASAFCSKLVATGQACIIPTTK